MSAGGTTRDDAGALYDFSVREYSTEGRWPNPDPLGKASTCPLDPQTQNRYAYVRNSPMSFVDPTGAQGIGFEGDDGGCDPEDPLCDPCFMDPELCFPFFPGPIIRININSLIVSAERRRPFPWSLLPRAFFTAFESGGGSTPRQLLTPRQRCLGECDLEYGAELALCTITAEVPPEAFLCGTEATIVLVACRNKCNREYPQ